MFHGVQMELQQSYGSYLLDKMGIFDIVILKVYRF
jgi:hypothetical protein